jgi:hypothetical protein
MPIFRSALYFSTIFGLVYLITLIFLNSINLSLSDLVNWVYRIVIILSVVFSVIGYRSRYAKKGIRFFSAFGLGMLTSLFLAIYMTISAYIFYDFVATDYNAKFESYYKNKRSEQMYNSLLKKRKEEFSETYRLSAADSLIVEKGLSKHLNGTHFYFTTGGAALINFIFCLVWGTGISLSVAFMAKK